MPTQSKPPSTTSEIKNKKSTASADAFSVEKTACFVCLFLSNLGLIHLDLVSSWLKQNTPPLITTSLSQLVKWPWSLGIIKPQQPEIFACFVFPGFFDRFLTWIVLVVFLSFFPATVWVYICRENQFWKDISQWTPAPCRQIILINKAISLNGICTQDICMNVSYSFLSAKKITFLYHKTNSSNIYP